MDEYFLLWVLIARTKGAILRARERGYARYGITNERRAVLHTIQKHGGHARPVEITRHLFRQRHTVTGMLKRYEGSGRSKIEVRLTNKGLGVFNQSRCSETDRRIFSVLAKGIRKHEDEGLWRPSGTCLYRNPRCV